MRALIVEDDALSRRAMVRLLKSMGLEVSWAHSVCEARWVLLTSPPKLVILDLLLPDGSGVEVLRLIRQQELNVNVAVLSTGGDRKLIEAIELRPETVFQKPVDLQAMRGWLNGMLERESTQAAE